MVAMVSRIVVGVVALLSSCLVFVGAAPSAEELALRAAITSKKTTTYVLKKNITLTRDLPPLAANKVLTVTSAAVKGAPFTIDGASKFAMFRTVGGLPLVSLTIKNVILTRSTTCIRIQGDLSQTDDGIFSKVIIDRVNFLRNMKAIFLWYVNLKVSNSLFSGTNSSAVDLGANIDYDGPVATFTGCTFTGNTESWIGGAAINAGGYEAMNITRCKFLGNKAEYAGGAVRTFETYKVVIRDSEFTNNVNTNRKREAEGGGALSFVKGYLYVYNSIFKNNLSPSGGAVRLYENDFTYGNFQNTKFIDNKATSLPGGAFKLEGYLEVNLCSCTFSGNVGVKKPNNIHVWNDDFLPVLFGTNPFVKIPLVTKEKSAAITFKKGSCVERYTGREISPGLQT